MPKSPNPDIIDKIYFRNIYSCQRKIYWYKVKVMETINAVWEHSYGEDCIPNFSANMEQPRHRWYEFKEGFSLTLVERAIRETKKDNKSTSFTVLDPFSGSGTSPLTALQSRCNAIGYEVNPFMSFVGKTKCQQRTKSIHDYTKELNRILVQRPFRLKSPLEGVSTFTGSGENGKWLFNLDVLRAYEALYQHIPRAQCFHKYGQTRLKENLFKNQNISCETLYGSAYRIFYGTILSSGSKLLMQHIPLTLK